MWTWNIAPLSKSDCTDREDPSAHSQILGRTMRFEFRSLVQTDVLQRNIPAWLLHEATAPKHFSGAPRAADPSKDVCRFLPQCLVVYCVNFFLFHQFGFFCYNVQCYIYRYICIYIYIYIYTHIYITVHNYRIWTYDFIVIYSVLIKCFISYYYNGQTDYCNIPVDTLSFSCEICRLNCHAEMYYMISCLCTFSSQII